MMPSAPYLRWQLQYRLRDDALNLPYAVLHLNDMAWHITSPDPWLNEGRFPPRVLNYIGVPFDLYQEATLVKDYYEAMRR